jgi:DNA-binding NarL/FixJ family response regulator
MERTRPNPRERRGRIRAVTRPARIRVLIVDDHTLFAEMLMLTLGVDDRIDVVGHALDGVEAIELAEVLRPDVILMDLHMPVLDGIEATGCLRRAVPTPRVVMLTASRSPADRTRAREAGAVGYVTKDCSAVRLLDAVFDAACTVAPATSWTAA